ncbi:MAG: nuclear transport factor 2 family protein [Planctomycetes bacterium]|nr:nuclear transport factor 2 family protein [Planctomycetota bacterium]
MVTQAKKLPATAAAYFRATNNHDAAAFLVCFSESAIVNDAGREFRGMAAIKAWCEHEIIEPHVTLEVLDATSRDEETVVTTKVDGNFDRTGLPDPVIINHHITIEGDKIVRLTCQLAGEESVVKTSRT